ncbi:MAG: [Fe-Fe] hydrogenase large subunit C-terminal domain-containing protein [Bacteroidales bacterium]|nr:[Fe-Fe] hydrogenase large subunit C-terminal domain-containing protein [Bacteroidales bacterium]
MADTGNKKLVTTIPDKCRVCYTCVRECPAKAIRIVNGQAEVMHERCIGCGNCVKVCSQNAKNYLNEEKEVVALLKSGKPVAALIAPTFPAEFGDLADPHELVGVLRAIGFKYVCEVAFGADLVAKAFTDIFTNEEHPAVISSDCPAVVYYVRQYHPDLVPALARIASPMVAMTRVVKKKYGKNIKTVFIGPCISKKAESDEVDHVLTFQEIRHLIRHKGIRAGQIQPSEFDPPLAGRGLIFGVKRGMLQTINIPEDLFDSNVLVAEGKVNFPAAIDEFEKGVIADQHLELLCCEGCLMGPGMSPDGKRYARRALIGNYVRSRIHQQDSKIWKDEIAEFSTLDLTQSFTPVDRRLALPSPAKIRKVLASIGRQNPQDHLNCGACGYDSCQSHAIAIAQGLAEIDMCLPYTIEMMHRSIMELNFSNAKLAKVQQALKHSEKLAHMGQLSAGIAHELNNPLGVVIMYANILLDECENEQTKQDLSLIVSQADRCKKIVGNLLNFARKNQVHLEEVNLVKLAQDSLASVVIPDRIQTMIDSRVQNAMAFVDTEQMTQVLTNLIKNAVDAMSESGSLTIRIESDKEFYVISVKDTGTGISPENMDKVFTPFFTTKEIGKGTGLGLATTYGIIKMHKGKIEVESNNDPVKGKTGTCFKILLPRNNETN